MNQQNEKESYKKKIDQLKQILDYLYEVNLFDLLNYILEAEVFLEMFNELNYRYLIDSDQILSYSEDSDLIKDVKPNIVEWIGNNHAIILKDKEFYLMQYDRIEDNVRYWYISKMKVNNMEEARKIGLLFQLLDEM